MGIQVTFDNFSNADLSLKTFTKNLADAVSMASSPADQLSAGDDSTASTYENNTLLDLMGTGACQFTVVYEEPKSGLLFGINASYSGSMAGVHFTTDNSPFTWSYLFSKDGNAWISPEDSSSVAQTQPKDGFSLQVSPTVSDSDDISISITIESS